MSLRSYIYFLLFGSNIILFILNNVSIVLSKLPFSNFGVGIQIIGIISMYTSYSFYKTDTVGWFGKLLPASHGANKLMNEMFSIFILFLPLFFGVIAWF